MIARTDSRALAGLDEAVARVNAALDAGADIAFVEAAASMAEVEAIPRLVRGPCLLNIVVAGKTPDIALSDAQSMGYRVAIMPSLLLSTVMNACDAVLASVRDTDRPPSSAGQMSVGDRFRRFGADEWNALRTRFRTASELSAAAE